ncbi:hypothetical protein SAMN05443246_5873 [Paenibacillus sp. GP183]|nr:hypothetical protein SAMN05443246_5873 [Paenibacillus sp. GP183]
MCPKDVDSFVVKLPVINIIKGAYSLLEKKQYYGLINLTKPIIFSDRENRFGGDIIGLKETANERMC